VFSMSVKSGSSVLVPSVLLIMAAELDLESADTKLSPAKNCRE
jgi:hypothetical protein